MLGHERGVGQSILWRVAIAGVLRGALAAVRAADDTLVLALNATARRSPPAARVVGRLAAWLAGVEVVLMVALALAGRRGSAVRMLAAVGLVYVLSEALGVLWPRRRPFAQLAGVERLAPHSAERSFPSRHVASGLAMAAVGGRAHPRLGTAMATVAWALGLSRVAAGLHYPSDVLGGALSGAAVGRLALSRPGSPARPGRS
jgi:undecaprenyl-diphosphatase